MNETEQIKQRIDIVEFISQYLSLKKAGANYKAPCPFHKEKTPSFMVSSEKQIFKCFGCGEGGDIFDFLMKIENLEFGEAIKILADKAGVQLEHHKSPKQYREEKNLKTKMFEINILASEYFQEMLWEDKEGKKALLYLKKRGLKETTIKKFQVGFAPYQNTLRNLLSQKEYSSQEIEATGDPSRFRARIIFPLFDVLGNIVGFTGRSTLEGQQPKYLNTADTPIFQKSQLLYALNFAKEEIKFRNFSVMVEGQMDVILSHQSGVKNAVASSGTALTPQHLYRLSRYSPNLILAFDSDEAGTVAAKKAVGMALEQEMNVKIAKPVGVKDPGEAIEKDPAIWKAALKEAKEAMEYFFEEAFVGETELDAIAKRRIATKLLPLVDKIAEPIARQHWLQKIARSFGSTEEVMNLALEKIHRGASKKKENKPSVVKEPSQDFNEQLLGLLILRPKLFGQLKGRFKEDIFVGENQQIYDYLKMWYNKDENKDFSIWLEQKDQALSKKAKLYFLQAQKEIGKDEDGVILQELNQIIGCLQEKMSGQIKDKYEAAIRKAEQIGDRAQVKELIIKFQQEIISSK